MHGRQTPRSSGHRTKRGLILPFLALGMTGIFGSRTAADDPKPGRAPGGETRDITMLFTKMDDLEVALKVTKYEPLELEKISPDFKTTYSVRNLNLQFKHPDKLRLEGRSATRGTALMILNGTVRFYSVPKFKIKKSEDLANSPGKRQSLLEYGGLVVPETMRFMQAEFVKNEMLQGASTAVFDLKYLAAVAGPHYRVWIDHKTHITSKREWFDGTGKLKATFLYLDPQEVTPSVWLPGRLEVRNAEGAIAAEVTLSDPKTNQKLPDSLFDTTQ